MDNNTVFFGNDAEERKLLSIDKLTADKEKELSIRILAGDRAKKELTKCLDLSDAKRQALQEIVDKGNKAFEKMVLANLPRAIKAAAETYRKNSNGLNEFGDYLQTALKTICKCAGTYDWNHRCRFGTYVHRSLIHDMMRENARNGYAVRIPEEYLPVISKLRDLAETDDIADSQNLTSKSELLLAACKTAKSLQLPVYEENYETEFGDTIADPAAISSREIEDRIDREEQIRKLRKALAVLSEEERDLLKGRMGFNGDPLPMRAFVGTVAKSISGVQKKQLAAEKHLREIYFSLPLAD